MWRWARRWNPDLTPASRLGSMRRLRKEIWPPVPMSPARTTTRLESRRRSQRRGSRSRQRRGFDFSYLSEHRRAKKVSPGSPSEITPAQGIDPPPEQSFRFRFYSPGPPSDRVGPRRRRWRAGGGWFLREAPNLPPRGFTWLRWPPSPMRALDEPEGHAARAVRRQGNPRWPARREPGRPRLRRAAEGSTAWPRDSGCSARPARQPPARTREGSAGGSTHWTGSRRGPRPARPTSAGRPPRPAATTGGPDHPARERAWPRARPGSNRMATRGRPLSVVSAYAE